MSYTEENPLRVLSLGWGVQSWTMAAMSALGDLPPFDYAIHADTTHEMSGTYEHAAKWTPWLEDHGVKVVTVKSKRTNVLRPTSNGDPMVIIPAHRVIDGKYDTANMLTRRCTLEWKIQPMRKYIRSTLGNQLGDNVVNMLMGISLDEWHRMKDSNVKYIKNIYPLVDNRINRAACIAWLENHNLDVPPKSSCTFCPYHKASVWNGLKKEEGHNWDEARKVDNEIRHANKSLGWELFVHRNAMPIDEAVKIPEDYGATQLELDIPCDSGMCFV